MKKKLSLALILVYALSIISFVEATTVTFYTDRASFEAQLSSFSTIDFEGIVPDDSYASYNTSMTDVDFSGNTLRVVEGNPPGGWSGAPFQSAFLASTYSALMTADLTTAGSGYTAAGGWFGSGASAISYPDTATLKLYGASGTLLDTQEVEWNAMSQGNVETFFGWIVDGDEITSITHRITGGYGWEAVDNFTYGYAVPEPATLSLLALGGVLLRKRQ